MSIQFFTPAAWGENPPNRSLLESLAPEPKVAPVSSNAPTRPNGDGFSTFNVTVKFVIVIERPARPLISIHPVRADIDHRTEIAPKSPHPVSSAMQDILELAKSVMLESSEFPKSTLLAACLPPELGMPTPALGDGSWKELL